MGGGVVLDMSITWEYSVKKLMETKKQRLLKVQDRPEIQVVLSLLQLQDTNVSILLLYCRGDS